MRDKSIPRTIFVPCGRPKDLQKRLVSCFRVAKRGNEHRFVDSAVVTDIKRNYVLLHHLNL